LDFINIITYFDSSNTVINLQKLNSISGKYSFSVKKDGFYRICTNIKNQENIKEDLFIRLKIENDKEEMNFDKALKTKDTLNVSEKINLMIKKSKKIIDNQIRDSKSEDFSSNSQMDYSRSLIFFTVIQIILVVSIGLCHFISFKNFLINNKFKKGN
jgi:hypothetical protein